MVGPELPKEFLLSLSQDLLGGWEVLTRARHMCMHSGFNQGKYTSFIIVDLYLKHSTRRIYFTSYTTTSKCK